MVREVLRGMEGPRISLWRVKRGKQNAEDQGVAESRLAMDSAHPGHLKLPSWVPPSCLPPPLSSCPLETLVLWIWKTVRMKRHGTRLSHPVAHQNCICHPMPTSLVFYMLCFIFHYPYLQPNCFLLNAPHFFPISFPFIHNLLLRLFSLQLFWH